MQGFESHFSFGRGALLPQAEMLAVESRKKNFIIGIPKEIDDNESRIALTPQATEILVQDGNRILIEKDAGQGACFSNLKYSEAGAEILDSKSDIYNMSDIILKVAPFNETEIKLVKEKQTIISSFIVRREAQKNIESLMSKKVNAIGFEYMRDLNEYYPVMQSMHEIAGYVAIGIASELLSTPNNGKGNLLGGITGIPPIEVLILGANIAGESAARAALGLGAYVKIFDNIQQKLINIQQKLGQKVFTSNYHKHILEKALLSAEVIIGAIQLFDEETAFYVSDDIICKMKQGSIIIDLSIDQGGCFETSRCTTHKKPVFKKYGVTHYCVPNITSRVARTSSIALSNIFGPMLLKMSESGAISNYIKSDYTARQGTYLFNGILTNRFIGNYFNMPFKNIDLLMAAF